MDEKAREILDFWKGLGPKGWWRKDEATDREIGQRFGALVERARRGEFDSWREDPQSCLALVILLDQFSRNIHRGSALAFAGDDKALEIADMALARGHDRQVDEALAGFFHLPFVHSERIAGRGGVSGLGRLRRIAPPNGILRQLGYALRLLPDGAQC